MPVNKNALLRYHTIDKCLSNTGRGYTFKEIHEAVNEVLFDNGGVKGISIRQLRDDIRFMREEGYGAPIETKGRGDQTTYYYDDPNFSINNSPINSSELEQLKAALQIMGRFEGSPEFEWVEDLSLKIMDRFDLEKTGKKIVGHDTNMDYSGNEYIQPLFHAITNKRVLEITYTPFSKEPVSFIFHPYYLKEYNKRWFVFGFNQDLNHLQWNVPLDRISSLKETNDVYQKDGTDWEDFFYEIIGVTRKQDQEPVDVVLRFEKSFAPYVITKPIHPSQKKPTDDEQGVFIKLKVIINPELKTLLNSFGDKVEVMEPLSLRDDMKKQANELLRKYL